MSASAIKRCHPNLGHEDAIIRTVRSAMADPDFIAGKFIGEFDEAPINRVEAVVVQPGEVAITVYGNLPYFDGEVEIMEANCQHMLNHVLAVLW